MPYKRLARPLRSGFLRSGRRPGLYRAEGGSAAGGWRLGLLVSGAGVCCCVWHRECACCRRHWCSQGYRDRGWAQTGKVSFGLSGRIRRHRPLDVSPWDAWRRGQALRCSNFSFRCGMAVQDARGWRVSGVPTAPFPRRSPSVGVSASLESPARQRRYARRLPLAQLSRPCP